MYTFTVGEEVQFTTEARKLFDNQDEYFGVFVVEEIATILKTVVDPFSPHYQGGQEGDLAVGHHQSVRLRGRDGWVSGALIDAIHHVDEPLTYEPRSSYSAAMFQDDFDRFFDILFSKAREGEITYDRVEQFFPKEVRERAK